MDARSVLATKRDGGELSPEEIEFFISGLVGGRIPDYQASALLMAIFVHGMGDRELECWTRAMLRSGEVLELPDLGRPAADKHSTGGVGDKASIPLAPAAAACGLAVPMISGRGLGHSGGTLDKLESIPGLRTYLEPNQFRWVLHQSGAVVGGQTRSLVPADGVLYALRDVTGLIASVPLVASSILSKKLAEGIDALVLDIKFGSGAFFPDPERGAELGRVMLRLAKRLGLRASALQTAMDRPLGRAIGNSLEIAEGLDCLEGGGPADLRELVCALGGEMLALVGSEPDPAAGSRRIARALDDGTAREAFARMVEAQGGDTRALDDRSRLPRAPDLELRRAPASGCLAFRSVRAMGHAVSALGGGRRRREDEIDPGVGLVMLREAGEEVLRGEALVEIHHREGRGLEEARSLLDEALDVGEGPGPGPLLRARLEQEPG